MHAVERKNCEPFKNINLGFMLLLYIDGCRSVDPINCNLVTPVSRQMQIRQSDVYQ